jgi:TRAP-type transport system small permease protein
VTGRDRSGEAADRYPGDPGGGLVAWLGSAYTGLLASVRVLTGTALAFLVAVVLVAVAVRYFGVFGGSLHWTDELARFTTIWMVMLGSVVAFERGAHTAVDMLPERLPPRVATLIRQLAHLVSAVFLVILAWQGWVLAMRTLRQVSPALGLPMGYVYLAVPVGAALMALQAIAFGCRDARGPG